MGRNGAEREADGERLTTSRRTLAALEVLARQPQGVTPKELSRALQLSLSTAYRLLNTLIDAGYCLRHPDDGLFRLSQRVAYLHQGFLAALQPPPGALPFLHALQAATGESAILNQLEGDNAVCTAVVAGSRPGALPPVFVGFAVPAHTIAAGRALLAWLSEAELERHIARVRAVTDTPYPLTDPASLRDQLARIRRDGYAVDRGEGHPDICCVAAAAGRQGTGACAAVGVMVSRQRLDQDESALVAAVLAATQAIGTLHATASERPSSPATEPAGATPRAEIEASLATIPTLMSRLSSR